LADTSGIQPSIEEQIGERLRQRGWKLVVAESCTGGLVGHRMTNIPGSSEYFLGSLVSYAYEAKEQWLDVRRATLERCGAVSRDVVLEMARGARQSLAAAFPIDQLVGISISGIAGPGGGMPEKPVGLAWIGLSGPGYENAWRFQGDGTRAENKAEFASQALRLLLDFLQKEKP
jgi:PncC family amidohydrolase